MKKKVIISLLILSALFLVFFEGCNDECIQNPVDDGVKPFASIAIIYKHEGQEVIKNFDSSMQQPASGMGFDVFIPGCTSYSLFLTGKDGGGVASMKLASVEFSNTLDMPVTKPYFTIFTKDYTSCIKKARYVSHAVNQHYSKRIHYELTDTDISGARSIVKIVIVPLPVVGGCGDTGPVCQQTGTISKSLAWNNDLINPVWSDTLDTIYFNQYCKGTKIKEFHFDINTFCDEITSFEWHVRIGSAQYDGLSDKDPSNPQHVRVDADVSIPLEQCLIKVWSDRCYLSDSSSSQGCDTGKLPPINIMLEVAP